MVYVDIDIGNGVIRKTKLIAAVRDPAEMKSGHSTIKIRN
jgi:hypothetical protein